MKKKRSIYERAAIASCRLWHWSWTTMPKTPADVHGIVAHAWARGYEAARRDATKGVRR